jgi:hypothetical protein
LNLRQLFVELFEHRDVLCLLGDFARLFEQLAARFARLSD